MRKKTTENVVSVSENRFSPVIDLINEFNAILNEERLSEFTDNKLVQEELTNFIEERLTQLINFETKKESFEPNEVKLLKTLLKKVSDTSNRANSSTPDVPPTMIVSPFTHETVNVTVQSGKSENNVSIPVNSLVNQETMDPLVKEFVAEQVKPDDSSDVTVQKHKPVLRSPTQQVGSVHDVNSYAMGQAAAASKKFDIKKLF